MLLLFRILLTPNNALGVLWWGLWWLCLVSRHTYTAYIAAIGSPFLTAMLAIVMCAAQGALVGTDFYLAEWSRLVPSHSCSTMPRMPHCTLPAPLRGRGCKRTHMALEETVWYTVWCLRVLARRYEYPFQHLFWVLTCAQH